MLHVFRWSLYWFYYYLSTTLVPRTYIFLDIASPPPETLGGFPLLCRPLDGYALCFRFEVVEAGFKQGNAFLGFGQLFLVRELCACEL